MNHEILVTVTCISWEGVGWLSVWSYGFIILKNDVHTLNGLENSVWSYGFIILKNDNHTLNGLENIWANH